MKSIPRNDILICILTHGRPHKQYTFDYLKSVNSSIPVYFVVDSCDDTKDEYRKLYGDECVLVYEKDNVAKFTDDCMGCMLPNRKAVLWSRNFVWWLSQTCLASQYKYIIQVDDDLSDFYFRYNNNKHLAQTRVSSFDSLITLLADFCDKADVDCLSMNFRANYMGGVNSKAMQEPLQRNGLSEFMMTRVDKPVKFVGYFGEDINTNILEGMLGRRWFKLGTVCFNNVLVGTSSSGGMSEAYDTMGKYRYYFAVMVSPANRKVVYNPVDGTTHLYQKMNNTFPKIISSVYKKE